VVSREQGRHAGIFVRELLQAFCIASGWFFMLGFISKAFVLTALGVTGVLACASLGTKLFSVTILLILARQKTKSG